MISDRQPAGRETDRQTDGRTDGQADIRPGRQTERRTGKRTTWADGTEGWTDRRTFLKLVKSASLIIRNIVGDWLSAFFCKIKISSLLTKP
jgi:hypothetical protein